MWSAAGHRPADTSSQSSLAAAAVPRKRPRPDAVYLFCSPESIYISGQVIVAGGGLII